VSEFWQLWQLPRDTSKVFKCFLTPGLSNLGSRSCKHNLHCNSSKTLIFLAFYIFTSLVSEFWQLWQLSRDASKVLKCFLTSKLSNLAPASCKHNLLCKSSKKPIYLALSTLKSVVSQFWQFWQMSRDESKVWKCSLTSQLSNLTPWSCKDNLHCNSAKEHIFFAFYTFMSLLSQFWQLWQLSRDTSKEFKCFLTSGLSNLASWSCKHNLHCNSSKKLIFLAFYIFTSLVSEFWQLWQLSRDASNV